MSGFPASFRRRCGDLSLRRRRARARMSSPDVAEAGSVESIAKFTTEPRFSSPWVAYVPASATVPSPTKFLGHLVGAPGELSRTSQIYGYFRALAEATPRVKVERHRQVRGGPRDPSRGHRGRGRDPEPRPPEGRDRGARGSPQDDARGGREDHRDGAADLLLQRRPALDRDRQPRDGHGAGVPAGRLGAADDQGHPQEPDRPDQPGLRAGRPRQDRRLVLPVPEGQDRLREPAGDVAAVLGPLRLPRQQPRHAPEGAGADAAPCTGCSTTTTRTAVHDLHESIPLLHTWNGTGPYNANLDPIAIGEWLETSFHEVQTLTSLGMPGVWTWGFGESWGLHYLDSVASNHNSLGRGYETFGNATAETVQRTLRPSREALRRQARHGPRVVPAVAARQEVPLVAPQQHELHAERLSLDPRLGLEELEGHAPQFLPQGIQLLAEGREGQSLRLRDSRRIRATGCASRRWSRSSAATGSRSARLTRGRSRSRKGAFAKGDYVVKLDQPYRNYAVDLLRAAEVPDRNAVRALRRRVLGACRVHYGLTATRVDDEKIRDAKADADRRPRRRRRRAGSAARGPSIS